MEYQTRATWRNVAGNQRGEPLRIYRPSAVTEVQAIVRLAEQEAVTVRAVGSHHAWSDAALTTGFLIETNRLARPLELEPALLAVPYLEQVKARGRTLVRTEAGIRLRELNEWLDGQGLALSNMGGYDEQTVAGVMATSTHGSGLEFGPISSFAHSVEVIGANGRWYRIERADGPTDPDRYRSTYPDRILVKDDDWFLSTIVSVGCFGVVVAVMLEVEPAYWLKEVRTLSTWREVREALRRRDVLRDNRHYEVYLNPHPTSDGDHRCVITTRNRVPKPGDVPRDKLERNLIVEIAAALPIVPKILNRLFDWRPKITPALLDRGLEALVDEYTNKSYKVLNIGAANLLPAYSSEIGVPVDDRNLHLAAVDRIIEVAAQRQRLGEVYHTSPLSLRFVRESPAFLSMMYGVDTMMIELILLEDTEGGFELLDTYENALYPLGGRPHWGQYNTFNGGGRAMRSRYPAYDRWQAVHQVLNSTRVFDSPFSKRVGINSYEMKGPA